MKRIAAAFIITTFLIIGSGCTASVTKNSETATMQKGGNYHKEGFETRMEDGRLWVFLPGSKDLAKFDEHGELAKHIIRPGAGPGGVTIKAPDAETMDAYLLARPGFITRIEDGRLWVFKSDSEEFQKFTEHGELAKHIIRPGAGPGGVTVKSPDAETLDSYMAGIK